MLFEKEGISDVNSATGLGIGHQVALRQLSHAQLKGQLLTGIRRGSVPVLDV